MPVVKRHCHKLIYETALEMAAAEYEEVMQNNTLYSEWKRSWLSDEGKAVCPDINEDNLAKMWAKVRAPRLIEAARKSLAGLLTSNAVNDDQKERISEALILDHSLQLGRVPRGMKMRDLVKAQMEL